MVVDLLPKHFRAVTVDGSLHGTAELVAELADKLGLTHIISSLAISAIPSRIIAPAIVIAIACITHHTISFHPAISRPVH